VLFYLESQIIGSNVSLLGEAVFVNANVSASGGYLTIGNDLSIANSFIDTASSSSNSIPIVVRGCLNATNSTLKITIDTADKATEFTAMTYSCVTSRFVNVDVTYTGISPPIAIRFIFEYIFTKRLLGPCVGTAKAEYKSSSLAVLLVLDPSYSLCRTDNAATTAAISLVPFAYSILFLLRIL